MKTEKKLGVWMDYSMAHLMEFSTEPFEVKTIESKFQHHDKEESLAKGESLMHKKEQLSQLKYYKKISNAIQNFYHVVLFGPTNAKQELFNMLREDHNFLKVKIEIKETDKMTSRQQQAFVRKHFSMA
ncbi:hypothetical protein [Flavobacterium sp.]|uniref:hypothetical protein n=1 Tax=Flavobacterium sp. TaxID=239 RepID=UPI00286B3C47|nr:hypothetical protein [Flavobacterium sp.]